MKRWMKILIIVVSILLMAAIRLAGELRIMELEQEQSTEQVKHSD